MHYLIVVFTNITRETFLIGSRTFCKWFLPTT